MVYFLSIKFSIELNEYYIENKSARLNKLKQKS